MRSFARGTLNDPTNGVRGGASCAFTGVWNVQRDQLVVASFVVKVLILILHYTKSEPILSNIDSIPDPIVVTKLPAVSATPLTALSAVCSTPFPAD
jgi:hypothetical protein